MSDQKFIDPSSLIGKSIPPEVLEQLRVIGRIQFQPTPTNVSAVSSSGETVDTTYDDKVSGVLDHVAEMEGIASQIEDMIDALTKDMAIPVVSDSVREAVKSLNPNGDGSVITKDVFDKANALIDHAPILMYGYDPVLAALVGDGSLDGKYLNCDDVTRSIANTWNVAKSNPLSPEQPVIDETSKIADKFEQNLAQMIIEILQGFFWNMIWPKYIVDLVIINPPRMLVNPIDMLILFFMDIDAGTNSVSGQKYEEKHKFRAPNKNQIEGAGPINKILNKMRCFLLCVPPRELWDIKKYKPIVPFDCDCSKYGNCPPKSVPSSSNTQDDSTMDDLSKDINGIMSGEACIDKNDMLSKVPKQNAIGLGVPPQCLKNAQIIMSAVISDALSPADPTKAGLGGLSTLGSMLTK